MTRLASAFIFFVVVGLLLVAALAYVLGQAPLLRERELLGMPLHGILAILLGVPSADYLRKKVFGARSFGERS